MRPTDGGSRIGIVFNGSPLFSGGAGSGESNIRKWIIENDMLEAIIALPDQLFYNTGIFTYLWFVTNRKPSNHKGKIQLINSVSFYEKMSKSLGNKRNYMTNDQIAEITRIYGDFEEGEHSKIFDNENFGYHRITVEQPLMARFRNLLDWCRVWAGLWNLFLSFPVHSLKVALEREVLPHVQDAWIDESKTKVGYEINFTKYFYNYNALRSLELIRNEIQKLEEETLNLSTELWK